jgi:hypothetical protein
MEPEIPHFMPGGLGGVKKMTKEEEAAINLKTTKYISEMDKEIADRFKALYALSVQCKEFEDEEDKEIKEIELIYEGKYKEIYALRDGLINEKQDLDMDLVAEFDKRAV